MKLNFFYFFFIFYFLKVSLAHKKFRKHYSNIDNLDNNEQIFNQTEHKLFTQLLNNFNENEQMSEILSIFKKIKAQVRQLDEKLSFYSKKVVSLNKDLNFYYSSNKFDSSDQSLTIIQINNNIKDLKTVKENMTNLLNELQGFLRKVKIYFLILFREKYKFIQ